MGPSRIGVEKSASHQLSQIEIASDNPPLSTPTCKIVSGQLSGEHEFLMDQAETLPSRGVLRLTGQDVLLKLIDEHNVLVFLIYF